MLMKEKEQQEVKSPKKESLSRRDLEELMGVKRVTLKKVHGAWKSK
jgi:hypothetical protein